MKRLRLRSDEQSHWRCQREAFGLGGKTLGVEGDEGRAGPTARVVQRVGEVQASSQVAHRGFRRRTDPVRAGFAASFARPGGNVTGLFMDQPALAGKWIELLRAAAPGIERVALLWDPGTGRDHLEIAQAAARGKGLDPVVIEFGAATNFDGALRGLGSRQRTGVVVLSSPNFTFRRGQFGSAAQKCRMLGLNIPQAVLLRADEVIQ